MATPEEKQVVSRVGRSLEQLEAAEGALAAAQQQLARAQQRVNDAQQRVTALTQAVDNGLTQLDGLRGGRGG